MLIGEVARHSGVSARMLRHYDRVGLLTPSGRTIGGYREYEDADLERLFHIEGLRSLGLSLAQIAEVIEDGSFARSTMIADLINRVHSQIAQANELLRRLESVQASRPRSWTDVLRTVELVRGLDSATPSRRQQFALSTTGHDEGDVAVLIEALLRESNEDAAGAVQWVLARIGDGAVPPLAAALTSEGELSRRRALDALEKIGTPGARRAIAAAIDHDDPRIRARAVLARGRDGEPSAVQGLVDLISEGTDDVEAADILHELVARTGLEDHAVDVISGALRCRDAHSRRRLAAALGGISGEAATLALRALLDDEDRGAALTARALLASRTDTSPDG